MSTRGIRPDPAGKVARGRKLIAIAYADMVDYSRLIGLDDAGTLSRLRTLRRARRSDGSRLLPVELRDQQIENPDRFPPFFGSDGGS